MTTDPVRITHPFHPQCGHSLEVIARRAQWGESRVFYHHPDGHRASLPLGWTSLALQDPYVTIGQGRSRFRVADLLELAAVLREVRR